MAYTNSPSDFRPPDLPTPSRPLWKDPLFWGAMISLGAHGVLWLISPLLPESDRRTEADVQRPVELVELSPIDQNRLPDALTQPPVLPDVANPDFSDPDFSSGSLESDPPISFAPIFPTLPPPPPPAISLRPSPWTRFPSRRSPSTPTTSPTPTETPDPPAETTDDGPNAEDLSRGGVITGDSNTTEGSSDTDPPVEETPPQFPPNLVAFVQENPDQFAFNEDGMGADAANENWGNWLDREAYPWLREDGLSDTEIEDKAEATFTPREIENVPYPPIACVASAHNSGKAATELTAEDLVSGSVVVGILVGPDGRVEEGAMPSVLQSSGFEFLDAEAREIAKAYEPPPTSWREVYSVQINFAPNPATCEQLLQEGDAPSEDA